MPINRKKEDLEFDGTITTSSKGSAILGRITGPCADIVSATRNGRKYSEALWDRVFKDEIIKEYFNCGGIFGELNHPTDREETDLEKVAICMPEPPVKNKDGKLIGSWDILDTPNGRIAKCLFDYGYKLGISSRGSGDTFTDYDGQESVDPETYTLQGFDLVYLPAVKSARLSMVHESLNTKKTFNKALCEALEKSTPEERKLMEETLSQLEIEYTPESEEPEVPDFETCLQNELNNGLITILTKVLEQANITDKSAEDILFNEEEADLKNIVYKNILKVLNENPPEKVDIDNVTTDDLAAEDSGAEVIEALQEALQSNQNLEKQIKSLQEQLSVCYTKEARYSEILSRTKTELVESQNSVKNLEEKVNSLNRNLTEKIKVIRTCRMDIKALQERFDNSKRSQNTLTENLNVKSNEVTQLETKMNSLNEEYLKKTNELQNQNQRLTESLAEMEKDVKILRSQTSAKLEKAQALVEKYKSVAKTAVDKYIISQARRIGVKPEEIKNKLNENYSFKDIDSVVEDLQKYKLAVNTLPFNVSTGREPMKVTIKESKETIKPMQNDFDRFDDDIDETLRNIIH